MKTDKNTLSIGILLIISGIIAALTSHEPSRGLQYVFGLSTLAVGFLALRTGRSRTNTFVRSTYYSWVGYVSLALSIALAIWGTTLFAFINVLGFFLLILGVIEFVFALQILSYETPMPWKLFGIRITVSALTSTGAGWILTTAGFNVYRAVLFLGLLLVLAGISFIFTSRLKNVSNAPSLDTSTNV